MSTGLKARFMALSLAGKLWAIYLLASGAALVLAAILLTGYLWNAQRTELAQSSQATAKVIAQNSASAVLFRDHKAAQEVVNALASDANVMGTRIHLLNGEPFVQFDRQTIASKNGLMATDPSPPVSGAIDAIKSSFHLRHLDVTVPIAAQDTRVGTLVLSVDLAASYQRLVVFFGVFLLAAVASIVIAGWLLTRLLPIVIGPIRQLVGAMHAVSSESDYGQRATATSNDEIGKIAKSFNLMIEQIQRRDEALSNELGIRKAAEIQLDRIAHYDTVTGLPNRRFFTRHAETLASMNRESRSPQALMFIDIDNFKYVNDNFGHPAGDLLLAAVATRLRSALRSNDFVSRLGGDEFAVLIQDPPALDAVVQLAEKMLAALAQPIHCDGREFSVGASIGIAMMPDHAGEFDELLSSADAAMYRAKAAGKNNVQVWTPEFSEMTAHRFSIESGLRKAIAQNEFEIVYQPIMALARRPNENGSDKTILATSRVVDGEAHPIMTGVEALLRWRHPVRGIIGPGEFIPIAEESHLIIAIGNWVLEHACAQAVRWQDRFGPLSLAVNVSVRQLREPGFFETVMGILAATGFPAHLLELEVTETVLMELSADMTALLDRLAHEGIRLSLDDFGTGYSSLAYLKRLPVSKLKIDRSFVADLPHDTDYAAISQAILLLASSLGMQVVAEGIEKLEQADFLREHGCEFGQGFLYSGPLALRPLEAFAERRTERRLRVVHKAAIASNAQRA
jgi:diguanylate cyclase (GGDEF)-like protein